MYNIYSVRDLSLGTFFSWALRPTQIHKTQRWVYKESVSRLNNRRYGWWLMNANDVITATTKSWVLLKGTNLR